MSFSYSIRAVVEETGLSAHTIRAWERRYGAPLPGRTDTNRRVYDEDDVRRLKLLQRAVASGHSIGMIAALPVEDLARLIRAQGPQRGRPTGRSDAAPGIVAAAMQAVKILDAASFDAALVRGTVLLGIDALADKVIVPVLWQVGQMWEAGELTIAQEHFASALIRTHLERTRLSIRCPSGSPRMIATTPTGQQHEFGAMLAAIVAARLDWDVTYLGPDLPAEEIADATKRLQASAVALSLVFPAQDPVVEVQLRELRRLLNPGVEVVVGGGAAQSYAAVLDDIGVRTCDDFDVLRDQLAIARHSPVLCDAP